MEAANSACALLTAAAATLVSGGDNRGGLSAAARSVSEAIAALTESAARMAPGAEASAKALSAVEAAKGRLDALRFEAERAPTKAAEACHSELSEHCVKLNEAVQALLKQTVALDAAGISAASTEAASRVAHVAAVTAEWVQSDARQRNNRVDLAAGATDSVAGALRACMEAARDPSEAAQNEARTASATVHSALSAVLTKLQGGVVGLRECDAAVQAVQAAYGGLQAPLAAVPPKAYRAYRHEVEQQTAALSAAVGALSSAANTQVDRVGIAAQNIASTVPLLFEALRSAANTSSESGAKDSLYRAANAVATALLHSLQGARAVAAEGHSNNAALQSALSGHINTMSQATIAFREALAAADGDQRAIEAALAEFSRILTALERASLAAASGSAVQFKSVLGGNNANSEESKTTATANGGDMTLADCHGWLVREAKHLVTAASAFAKAAKSEQGAEKLPALSKNMAACTEQVVASAARVAGRSPEQFTQQAVLHAAKSLSMASQQLVMFGAAGDTEGDHRLAEPGLLLADSLEKLVDTSKGACAHVLASRHSLQEARRKALAALQLLADPARPGSATSVPRDIQQAARVLAKHSGGVASSLNDADALGAATREAGDALELLADASKGCALRLAPSPDVRARVAAGAGGVARSTYALLGAAGRHQGSEDLAAQKQVADAAEAVSDALVDLLGGVRQLPGGEDVELEKDDLADAAQRELNEAARKIEAATQRLLAIKPPPPTPGSAFNEAEINAAILEAVKAVMGATQGLIVAATAVQKELVASGKTSNAISPYRRDPAWARGLISAAFAVADTTDNLVEATNSSVTGASGIDAIVAAVRMVGGSTARLVTASRVKADPNSPSQQKLEVASRRVTKATRQLADAAKSIAQQSAAAEAAQAQGKSRGKASAIAEEFRKQQEIAELELRLERARGRLGASRRDKYKK